MSRPNTRRIAHAVRFDIRVYLNQVIADLAFVLGDSARLLLAATGDPLRFRQVIGDLLSDADCMDDTDRIYEYAALRQVEACISKLPAFGASSAAQRRQAALEKFEQSERACARANKRLDFYRLHPRRLSPTIRQVINEAQDILHRVLGLVPDNEQLFSLCGFGPGLTFALGHDERHLAYKLDGNQTVTPEAKSLALKVLAEQFPNWAWHLRNSGQHLTVVEGNRISFVPKSSKIDRTIGIEPSLNVFLQKGIDEYLKPRLGRINLRLRDQEYSIACMREYRERISTIDLSSASDSVSRAVVEWLLPSDWFMLLDVLRSKSYTLDKGRTWSRYEKFSSMGNAATFPLESMIFMALARGCARVVGFSDSAIHDLIRVYGDDIIVPWECSALLIETLQFLGFRTNTDKTFVFGPFRETCGVDLLHGVDVRPVYLRDIPTKPWQIAGLYNRLLSNRVGFPLPATLTYLHSLVEKPLYGPAWFGQSSLRPVNWQEWYAGKCFEGDAYFFAPHAHHLPVRVTRHDHSDMVYALDRWGVQKRKKLPGIPSSARYLMFLLGTMGGEPLGEPVIGVTRSTLYYGQFPDLNWWPDVYTAPRPASDRVLRQITSEVVGLSF